MQPRRKAGLFIENAIGGGAMPAVDRLSAEGLSNFGNISFFQISAGMSCLRSWL